MFPIWAVDISDSYPTCRLFGSIWNQLTVYSNINIQGTFNNIVPAKGGLVTFLNGDKSITKIISNIGGTICEKNSTSRKISVICCEDHPQPQAQPVQYHKYSDKSITKIISNIGVAICEKKSTIIKVSVSCCEYHPQQKV